ncbi:hypothetical protein [Runella zeae]|uniref:hypothetical protein n=1 Tax=Runella zeae TaxID=94255 RepID=UPI002356732F|nr:hypothetical protein [Runella zeae]
MTLRHHIIDQSLEVEELISTTLGYLLNIEDWKKSTSFGYGSASLAFSQKMNIIKDLVDVNSVEEKKLISLVQIRNKFAHVKSVETLEDFFSLGSSTEDIKKSFRKWYPDLFKNTEIKEDEPEDIYIQCFDRLIKDTTEILNKILSKRRVENILKDRLDKVNIEILNNYMHRTYEESGEKKVVEIIKDAISQTSHKK